MRGHTVGNEAGRAERLPIVTWGLSVVVSITLVNQHPQPSLPLLLSSGALTSACLFIEQPPIFTGVQEEKEGKKNIKLECSHRFAIGGVLFLFAESKGPFGKQPLTVRYAQ